MSANAPSNGTMGSMWQAEWCEHCTRDHGFSHVSRDEQRPEDGCPHFLSMLVGDGPFDFLVERQDPDSLGWDPRRLECRWFDRCHCRDEGGEDIPRPVPVSPDQGLLFDVLEDSPVTPGGVAFIVPDRDAALVVPTGDWL